MATTTVTHTTIAAIRDRIVGDLRRQLIRAGITAPNVAPGSERYIRAEAYASALFEVLAKQVALQDAQMADTAVGDDLTRLATLRGLARSSGAGATGNVVASCTGIVSYPAGLEWKTADGLRYQVVTTTLATTGTAIPVAGVDVGERTDKAAGTSGTWSSPPAGSATTAVVDASGLTNGVDADTDASLRRKLLDRIRNPPHGGNWADYAQDAEEASAGIEKAFVYPALYGPSTVHVAIQIAADADAAYTRIASSALQLLAATNIASKHPEHSDLTLTTVQHYDVDLILKLTIPEPKSAGGAGGGWIDDTTIRWPRATMAGAPYAVRLASAPTNPKILSVTSTVTPIVDAHIAIWSSLKKKLIRTRIATVTGAVAPFTLGLYDAVDINELSSGDYIMADAERLDQYCNTVAASFAGFGPGEKETSVTVLPRAYRRPLVSESWPKDFTSREIAQLNIDFPEVSQVTFFSGYHNPTYFTALPVTCPPETTVGAAPYVLRIGNLSLIEL